MGKQKYDIAAYIWPSYTGDEPRTRIFWPEGNGEWETVREAVARFPGHEWPRRPLWGYCNEADPYVMESQINAAADHGVNVFIYDWYWFDNRPFLDQCLDKGFLKARNRDRMKFYIMWANHNVTYQWDRRISEVDRSTFIWLGTVGLDTFKTIAGQWFDKYFCQPEYYTIDGEPVVSIYELENFINGLGSLDAAREAIQWLKNEAVCRGYKGVHVQHVSNKREIKIFDPKTKQYIMMPEYECVKELQLSSATNYQMITITGAGETYPEKLPKYKAYAEYVANNSPVPHFAHVSVGWDETPRYKSHIKGVIRESTPENFKAALEIAKEYTDKYNKDNPLITINSWNEWTEGSYLEPDDLHGYGYLEAIKEVFCK